MKKQLLLMVSLLGAVASSGCSIKSTPTQIITEIKAKINARYPSDQGYNVEYSDFEFSNLLGTNKRDIDQCHHAREVYYLTFTYVAYKDRTIEGAKHYDDFVQYCKECKWVLTITSIC